MSEVTLRMRKAARALSIVLVRPPSVLPLDATNAVLEIPPIGLAYLAAALREAGHRVTIVDAFGEAVERLVRHAEFTTNGLDAEQIAERIPGDVDLVGVTCMFSNAWIYCRRTIEVIAERFPGVPIIVGGEHPTADHRRLLEQMPSVLCCVLGEGEDTVVDLAARIASRRAIDDVPGIALRSEDGTVRKTAARRRIREVDDIPWPDWSTVPLASYLDNDICSDGYAARAMPLIASRGCPYQCTFCSSPQMFGTRWVARDPRQVIDEIEHYARTLGVRYFEFHDLTMIVKKEWIVAFCKELHARGLDVQWSMPSGTRSEALDADVLGWMKRSGCRSFSYAAESGSKEELRRIKKKISPERMLASMRAAIDNGLVTKCHLIFGMPGQTKRDVIETVRFVHQMALAGVHDLGCYAFSPYPGSELYDDLVAEGRIDPAADDYDRVLAQNVCTNYRLRRSWTPHLPGWSVGGLCTATMAYFYALQLARRPSRAIELVVNVLRDKPETYLQRMLAKKLGLRRKLETKTTGVQRYVRAASMTAESGL